MPSEFILVITGVLNPIFFTLLQMLFKCSSECDGKLCHKRYSYINYILISDLFLS